MSISQCFPSPVPVRIAGRDFLVSQLRLRDMATLESWAVSALPRPDEGLSEDSPDSDLKDGYDAALEWPPEFGDPAVNRMAFGLDEGRTMTLLLALRDDPSRVGPDLAREIVAAATADEWAEFEAAAMGRGNAPFLRMSSLVDARCGLAPFAPARGGRGREVSWSSTIREACEGDASRLEAVGNLTIGQWRMLCGDDGREDYCDPLPADPEHEEGVIDARARFWNPDAADADDAADEPEATEPDRATEDTPSWGVRERIVRRVAVAPDDPDPLMTTCAVVTWGDLF